MNCTSYVAKTKALISFTVTAKLICVFVFAYAKSRFSHDTAHRIHKIFKMACICQNKFHENTILLKVYLNPVMRKPVFACASDQCFCFGYIDLV